MFFRTSGVTFLEYVSDWTYQNPDPKLRMNSADRSRYQWSYTGTWTRTMGSTVLDTSFATNRFNQVDKFLGLKQFTPTDVGLPSYLDEFCSTHGGCTLPSIGIGGYQGIGGGLGDGDTATHIQGQSSITSVKGQHTLHGGVDVRRAQRDRTGGGNRSGQLTFDRTYTRQFSDESTLTPSNLGLSLAAFELGLPTSASINDELPSTFSNYWTAAFGQDTWRLGERHRQRRSAVRVRDRRAGEERPHDRRLGPDGARPRSPTPRRRPTWRAACRTRPACRRRSACSAARSTPATRASASPPRRCGCRASSAAYLLGARTVLKGGYGLYYDTLTAADYFAAQAGYSVTTTSTISDDLGRTFKWATPATGSASFDPFPVRADGTRWDPIVGDTLGVNTVLGGALTTENGQRQHARQQRWRVSLQRELMSNLAVEVAYTGAFNDRLPVSIRGDYLPEQYWDGSNTRNTAANAFLTANVANPYFINNFASLQTTDPVLYQRLASNPTFSSATIQRQRLLRPFGALTNLTYANLPLGESKSHSLEVQVNRRLQQRPERLPLVQPQLGPLQPDGRGVRARADALAGQQRRASVASRRRRELRAAVRPRQALAVRRRRRSPRSPSNWQISGTWEFQPGALLDWGGQNIFFYGDLDDIAGRGPDARALVQHRRGLRTRSGEDSRGVPEARLPVPHRRCARHAADVHEPVDPAQLRRRRRLAPGRSGSTRRTSSTVSSGTDRR